MVVKFESTSLGFCAYVDTPEGRISAYGDSYIGALDNLLHMHPQIQISIQFK